MKFIESPPSERWPVPHSSAAARPKGESPKGFFRLLRSDHSYFHRVFASRLGIAGFCVGGVRKRANHGIWNLRLHRGNIALGAEAEIAREVISAAMPHFGVNCPKREIEVAVIGDRITVAFRFNKGAPGSLVFTKGRESWCAEQWP